MNIFVTSDCPQYCAKYLDDKRVVKMVLESAQMLSTAINEAGANGPYKSTHVNHPCNIWARTNRENYKWLVAHFNWLCKEYTVRYGKIHKCEQYLGVFMSAEKLFKEEPRTQFANCAANKSLGVSFKDIKPITKAYKCYLATRWMYDKRKPTWYGNNAMPNLS